ncbi:Fructosamine kinase-domain-containing protein [Apodospora peruviana]|uniref:protein-ribulosamine 3-kinase n=1 Tax=Apodospora peruviana TaxID=516989 RepID=A0AAE0HWI1_9PEZI|nr:Fructosamine kinase-domain-containing protein [Apodospora peruviana]
MATSMDLQPTDSSLTAVDPAVLADDCSILSVSNHGASTFGAETRRIEVELADGRTTAAFFKAQSGKTLAAKDMLRGEFESTKAIHDILPTFAPKPIARGTYADEDIHLILTEFRAMTGQQPEPEEFAAKLAAVHMNSRSPNGKFGFHVTTYPGNLPQFTEWEDSWEVFFTKSLRQALDLEQAARGHDPEFDVLVPAIFGTVIPRLLRPLETGGRSVKPSLVHGDLWYGNAGVDADTNESLVLDPACFYAHNEYELGQWMPACNRFGMEYRDAYHSHVEMSEPKEDYDGRLELYKLRFNAHVSALFPENKQLREQMLGDMRNLVYTGMAKKPAATGDS